MELVKKEWGHEEILVNGPLYCLKRLVIKPGWCCSIHKHHFKDETFVQHKGAAFVFLDGEWRPMWGRTTHIPPETYHRFASLDGAALLEVSTHHEDSDVSRTEGSRLLTLEEITHLRSIAI